jgi:4-hydroxyphenylpyruvate dioxygenase-like putative hemolysin
MIKNIFTLTLLFALTNVQAVSMDEVVAAVKQAHPFPNLMRVITQHQDDMLELSEEQISVVNAWIKKHRPIVKELALSIKAEEQALKEAALNDVSKDELMTKLNELLAKRKQMAIHKIDCRDTMRQILSDEQWKKVVELYNSGM